VRVAGGVRYRFRCHGAAFHPPGFLAAPGRRPSLSSPERSPRVERQAALFTSVHALRRGALGEGRAPPGAPLAAFFDSGPRFPGHFRPDQPAPGGGTVVSPRRSPGPPRGAATLPRAEEPHPAPPARRLAMTPSDERGVCIGIYSRKKVKRHAGRPTPRDHALSAVARVERRRKAGTAARIRLHSIGPLTGAPQRPIRPLQAA
jgi:hypothetical protein